MTPLDAQQATLAGEHAAVYLYEVLGAQASQSRQPQLYARLLDGFHVHRKRRDQLTVTIAGAGATPVPSVASPSSPSTSADTAHDPSPSENATSSRVARRRPRPGARNEIASIRLVLPAPFGPTSTTGPAPTSICAL